MTWEQRSGKRYFYEARRIGKKVIKTYIGSGPAAHQAEREAQDRIARRRQDAAVVHALKEALAPIDQLLAELDESTKLLMHGSLLAAGLHQHSGTWRKRRERQEPRH